MSQDHTNQDKGPSEDGQETPVNSSQSSIMRTSFTSSSSGEQVRSSVFRVENVDLRCLFGYIVGPLDPDRPFGATQHEVTGRLERLPNIPGSLMKACLVVGFDVDKGSEKGTQSSLASHVGVCLLDTEHIWKLVSEPRELSEEDPCIVSHQFQLKNDASSRKKERKLCFGENVILQQEDFKSKFEELIDGKNFVLVCHNGKSLDLKFLKDVGIDTDEMIILDTVKVAEWTMQATKRLSLNELNETLGIDDCNGRLMHTAGNDANFCVRVLLMLVVKDIERLRVTSESLDSEITFNAMVDNISDAMKNIALAPRRSSQLEQDDDKLKAKKREKEEAQKQDLEAREREQQAEAQQSLKNAPWEWKPSVWWRSS